MKKFLKLHVIFLLLALPSISMLYAQMDGLHGDDREYRRGLHSANQVRLSFFNDGSYGINNNSTAAPNYGGEWPINSGRFYLLGGSVFVASEVSDNMGPTKGTIRRISSTVKANGYNRIAEGDHDPISGAWWTFLPLPGFSNPGQGQLAMAKGGAQWGTSWPSFWPDIRDINDPRHSADGWAGSWNGYFGRDVFNADEEAYFVADDYAYQEFPNFRPDLNDLSRGGLGIRMSIRSFAWSKTLVEDAIFCLYDLKNIGTYQHTKIGFGYKIGNNVGETSSGSDAGDDGGAFDRALNLAWTYDNDGAGAGGWRTTGLMGGAFLESPGNPFDGIDNDNDGVNGSGDNISEAMFAPRTLGLNDQIVLINYADPNYPRTVTTLANALASQGKSNSDTLVIRFNERDYKFWAGATIIEDSTNGANSFDDNLNGLIDESRGARYIEGGVEIFNYLYIVDNVGYKCKNYITGAGLNNLLIDERRDDEIDNNNDWNPETDDVGTDGVAPGNRAYLGPDPDGTERNGRPDPGEPRFDQTDIYESDMLGLTSFDLYQFSTTGATNHSDDEFIWRSMIPGRFRSEIEVGNVELMFGSGYFPLPPGVTERFSIGLIWADGGTTGQDISDLIKNKNNVQLAYAGNYNFAKAPDIPKVRAVVGDKRVTLFWDNSAESSVDPVSTDPGGLDFEGYKIYRSTSPDWSDAVPISNALGTSGAIPLFRKPIAQFDLVNRYEGFAKIPTEGVHFFLGNNTGLRHFWVDTNVINGQTYYYAVTSYDHGDDSLNLDPSECSKFIAIGPNGDVLEKGTNVVAVKPEAPSAGYVAGQLDNSGIVAGPQNSADGSVIYQIVDPTLLKNNHTYKIVFQDTTEGVSQNLSRITKSFSLIDLNHDDNSPHIVDMKGDTFYVNNDTILHRFPLAGDTYEGLPIVNGIKLEFRNNPARLELDSLSRATVWNRSTIAPIQFQAYSFTPPILLIPDDFEVIFSDIGVGTSKPFYRGSTLLPAMPVNFRITNRRTKQDVDFAFREIDTMKGGPGVFSWGGSTGRQTDEIIFLTKHPTADTLIASWWLRFNIPSPAYSDSLIAANSMVPKVGDVLTLNLNVPFLSHDTFEFTTLAPKIDQTKAKVDMERIRVVPNPYIVTNSWERRNPYIAEQRDRQLHFTHLPQRCTIRIFNVRGQLVNTLEHNSTASDGTYVWNMLSKDNLELSYGIYIYHVSAEGVGEKIGKFAVIK